MDSDNEANRSGEDSESQIRVLSESSGSDFGIRTPLHIKLVLVGISK